MRWWKRFSNRFKKYEKWIEIKVPDYLQNREDTFFKDDDEMLNDEERVLQELELGREEE
jgi:hypothetical protein